MALVTRAAQASLDLSNGIFCPQLCGNLLAGEVLDPVAPCYIKSADGKAYMSNGTAANEAAKLDGWTARLTQLGEAVTLFGIGARFRYGTGLTIGAPYFIAATAGRLDTAATTGGLREVARAINATDIRITKNTDAA